MISKVVFVDTNQLLLDPNNYRLINDERYSPVSESMIQNDDVQKRTYNMLRGDKNENIKDLLDSFLINGYLPVDQIQVSKFSDEKYLVLEGNRRTAALKYLRQNWEENSIDLRAFDIKTFYKFPVLGCEC